LRRVPQTMKITALSSRLLRGVGEMEMAQAALKSVDPLLGAGLDFGDPALGEWPMLLVNWLWGRGLLGK